MAEAQAKDNSGDKENFVDELKPGTKLMHGQYTIENFLNAGGFGITYLARDSLDRKVVIKECFPGAFCRRSRYVVQARSRAHQNELKSIVRLFVQEARSLAKLDHPNIVGVHQVFEDNDTAYMALDFVEGRDLLDIIEDPNEGLLPAQTKTILKEVLGAVGFIHDQGILHRDISPDNILINKDYHPVLIDFGAAREEATKQSRVLSALRVVKDGYSPQEFYIAGSDQSPSSDLYALAASFHHLIAGDVPPNSQARLAAIASGESDPYEPLAGRFPDYEEPFLAALDKALAVLPKDRVQSAQEWLEMMDGDSGNVTPLNAAAAAAVDGSSTPAAAAAKKSNTPLLLGTAAVIALLAGVGVMTMTGGEDATATEAATTTPPATETATTTDVAEAGVAEEAAATTTEEDLPEPQRFSFLPDTSTTTDEGPATATDATPVAPVDNAPAEPVEEAAATTTQEDAVAEAIAEAVTPEASEVIETPEPAPAPEIIADTPVAAPLEDAPAVVEGPTVTDTLTPAIRPEARPESVELAAVPEAAPLPEPVETPSVAAEEPAIVAVLPEISESQTLQTALPLSLSLPITPDAVSSVGTGRTVDIAALVPGNELVTVTEEPVASAAPTTGFTSDWTVRLPFTAAGERSNIIAAAGEIAPVWVEPGVVITGVNGTPVEAIADIPGVLQAQTSDGDNSVTLAVTFDILNPATGNTASEAWVLPVVQEVELTNGARFETVFRGSGWSTSVVELPEGQDGGLQVGDVITSYIPTGETLNARDTLTNILDREVAQGTTQYMFAVQREGSLWVASLAYDGGAQ